MPAAHMLEPRALPATRRRVMPCRKRFESGRQGTDDRGVARAADSDLLGIVMHLDDPSLRPEQFLFVFARMQTDFGTDENDEIGGFELVECLVVLGMRIAETDFAVVRNQSARHLESERGDAEPPRQTGRGFRSYAAQR